MKSILEFLVKSNAKKSVEYILHSYINDDKNLFVMVVDDNMNIIDDICKILPKYKDAILENYIKAKKRYGEGCSYAILPVTWSDERISYLGLPAQPTNKIVINDKVTIKLNKDELIKYFNQDDWGDLNKL